jgi:hypothetical protein
LALKPLKPSKAKRKGSKHLPSVEQQAQEYFSRWQAEVQRRRKAEETLGSVQWRLDPTLKLGGLEPLVRQRVLQLLG